MATFKPTSKATKTGGTTSKTFTPTKYAGYNQSKVYGWQAQNKSALDLLNEYYNRINAGEWLSNEDRAKYKSAIDTYTTTGNALRDVSKFYGTKYTDEEEKSWQDSLSSLNKGYTSANDFYNQFADDKAYNVWKQGETYKSVLNQSDFDNYYNAGINTANPDNNSLWRDRYTGKGVNNMVTLAESGIVAEAFNNGDLDDPYNSLLNTTNLISSFMSDDEKKVYNYYVGKGDKAKAEEYLNWLTENELKKRQAGHISNVTNNRIGELGTAFNAGMQSGMQGIYNAVQGILNTGNLSQASSMQIATAYNKQDNTGVWGVMNDLANTTGNMVPSIAIGMLNPTAGNIAMGVSAGGNAYTELINEGYSPLQAKAYGGLVGASEALLGKWLGGITSLGGGKGLIQSTLSKVMPAVSNAALRTIGTLGKNMVSEFTEEALQTALEPALKYIATGGKAEWDPASLEEIIYSGFLGALSAGALEGIPTIANGVSLNQASQRTYGAQSPEIVAQALELNPNDKLAKVAQNRLDKGKNVSGLALNELVGNIEQGYIKQDTGKIKSAVENRLTELGERGNVAKISDAIAREQAGEELSLGEKNLIKKSDFGKSVRAELNPETLKSDTEMNRWAESIGTRRLNSDVYSKRPPSVKVQTNEGKSAEIGSIKAVEGDVATVELSDGTVAKVGLGKNTQSEVKFNDAKTEEMFKIATERVGKVEGWTVESANAMVTAFESNPNGLGVSDFTRAWSEAYNIGRNNNSRAQLDNSSYATLLDEATRSNAYNIGKAIAIAPKTITSNATYSVTFDEGIDPSTFNKKQKNDIKALEIVSKALGLNVKVFDSPVNAKGERIGKNGSYNPTTRTIEVDLHAGNHGEGIINLTSAHEVTHHMKVVARDQFNNYADAVFETLGEDGKVLIANKLEQLSRNGHLEGMTEEEAYDLAFEEVVADSSERMFVDTDALVKLAETLKKKDKTLWEKFRDGVVNILNKLKKAYAELNPQSEAAQALMNAQDKLEKIQKLWVEGVVAAAEVSDQVSTEKSEVKNQDRDFEDYDKPITIEDVNILRSIGRKSINDFTPEEIKKAQKWAYKFYQELGVKSPFFRAWFGEWRAHDNNPVKIVNIDTSLGITSGNMINRDTNRKLSWNKEVAKESRLNAPEQYKNDIQLIATNLSKVIENSILLDTFVSKDSSKRKLEGTAWMHSLYSVVNVDGKLSLIKLFAEEAFSQKQNTTFTRAYTLKYIQKIAEFDNGVLSKNGGLTDSPSTTINSISDLYEFVKSYDKDFSPAPEVNKVMLNEDGTPRVFYHGTRKENGEFWEFDYNKAKKKGGLGFKSLGQGNYFTSVKLDGTELYGSRVIEAYLSIKAPLIIKQGSKFKEEVSKVLGRDVTQSTYPSIQEAMRDAKYDGVILLNENNEAAIAVTFDSEQIKSATDNIGAFSKGEKNIKYSDRTYLEAVEQGDMATAQKMVDEAAKKAGYTERVFHGTRSDEFYVFDSNRIGDNYGGYNAEGGAFDFTYDEGRAWIWAGKATGTGTPRVIKAFIKAEKPFYSYDGQVAKELFDLLPEELSDEEKRYAMSYGIPFKEVLEQHGIDFKTAVTSKGIDSYKMYKGDFGNIGVYSPFQIKSADPVTYDDDGNVIPLSERFNSESNDIRYQDRLSDEESFSNRSILANALASTVQHEVEQKKLDEYRSRIAMLDAEEAKLSKLKAEIKELTFGDKRDPARLKEIKEEARKTEARIDLHDKKLLQLESTTALKNVLERARKDSYAKAMQKGKELMHKNVEGRYKTIERNKIKKIAHELDTLLNKGNKKRNVKIGAQGVVRAALDLSDMYFTSDDELVMNGIKTEATDKEVSAMEQYKALYEKLHATDDDVTNHKEERAEIRHEMNELKKDFAELLERERKRINNTKAKTVYNALIEEYEKLANSPSRHIAQAFDADTLNHIKSLRDNVGENLVSEMTLEQIKDVYKAFKMVKTMVTNSNKLFNENLKESVDALGNSALHEIEKHGHKEKFTKVGKTVSEFSWNNLKPVYLMERTGSTTLQKLFQKVLDGESVWAKDMLDAREYIEKQKNEYKYDSWDFKKTYEFSTPSGKTFKLNLEQIMTIYAYSKRGEQAIEHLRTDGFVFDEVVVKEKGIEFELNDKSAYKITDEARIKMIGLLTQDQKAYVDAMQKYLSKTMGAKGNEISKVMYGIELYGEENYLPIHSEGAYLERAREQAKGDVKLKNKGFTKSTVKHARNAIVLSDFDKLCTEHIAEMSSYHAFTLPLEDFYKVYNYQVDSDDVADKRGVIPALENAYGKGATGAIDQLLTDLNGGARGDSRETIAKKLVALYKKAKVMLSLSVVIQQPSSIIRAQAMIDPKYFVGQKIGDTKRKELWAEMKKYAPVTIIKEMGYFDVGMGKASADWLLDDPTLSEKIDEIASKPAAKADELTWIAIWNAVKRETASKNTSLNTSSVEFLEKAGERFEDVIRHTQVYDSTLARSGNMRSKSALMQMATSFMAEPTTSLNMREAALRSKDARRIARTTAAIYGATLLNAVLVAIPYAMRDDDEDETFGEKYITALSTSFVDNLNPINSIPFAKDVWSLMQGYNVDRADMSAASNLIDSFNKLVKMATKEDREQGDIENAILNLIGNLSSFSGLPIDNVRRDVMSVFNTYKTLTRGYDTTWKSIEDALQRDFQKSTPVWNLFKTESKNEKLYEAVLAKDEKYVERFKSTYQDEDAYYSALRKAIRENDPRVQQIIMFEMTGDYSGSSKIESEIIKEGHFDKDKVIGQGIDAEIGYVKSKLKEAYEYNKDGKPEKADEIYKELIKRGYTQEFIDKVKNKYKK